MSQPARPDAMLGRRFGGAVVVRLIGMGGMGAVYEAQNALLGKRYAIKVVLPERAGNKAAVERLLVEARAAAAVEHPYIVPIVDCGYTDSGEPFVQMPYLDGMNLDDYCEDVGAREGHPKRLELATAAPLFFQVLDALAATHDRQIVHRDLKGANIMVLPDGTIRVVDFGIAKLFDAPFPVVRTDTSQIIGTPGYMAPEQVRALPVDARTDLFALGAVFFRVLTGRLPFEGGTFVEMAAQAMVAPRPSATTLVPSVPTAVSALLSSCLAVEPDHRPASARQLAYDLMAAIPGGDAIAGRVAPGLTRRSGPGDRTIQQGLGSPGAQVVESSVTPPSNPPAAAAGPSRARTTLQMRRRRPRLGLAVVLVGVALGVTAMVVATRADREARRLPAPTVEVAREGAGRAPSRPAPPRAEPSEGAPDHGALVHSAPAEDTVRAEIPDAGPPASAEAAAAARARPVSPPAAKGSAPAAKRDERPAERTRRPARSRSGTLVVKVDPFAEVWIAGEQVGSTPLTHELAVGRHRVELRGPMGKSETLPVMIRAGRTTRITRTWRKP